MTVVVSDCEGFLPQVAVIRPVRARRGWSELRRKWHHSTLLSFLSVANSAHELIVWLGLMLLLFY